MAEILAETSLFQGWPTMPICYSCFDILLYSCIILEFSVLWSSVIESTYLYILSKNGACLSSSLFMSYLWLYWSLSTEFLVWIIYISYNAPAVSFSADTISTCYEWYFNSVTISLRIDSNPSKCPRIENWSIPKRPLSSFSLLPISVFFFFSKSYILSYCLSRSELFIEETNFDYVSSFKLVTGGVTFGQNIRFDSGLIGIMFVRSLKRVAAIA